MRVLVVYDCLFPHTVGGAERWYRNVAERLAQAGHEVTYATLRQWEGDDAGVPGVRVLAVAPRMGLYTESGRRRIGPPLVFGAGLLWHLLRHGRRYDVVHTASFPFFSVLAAALLRPLMRYRIVVDWHEAWTLAYWQEYLGRTGGRIGWLVQELCARVPQRAFAFSRMHAARVRGPDEVTVLPGEYDGGARPGPPAPAEPVVVFAGRHIPEKRAPALVPALARARRDAPELRGEIYGDGPEREQVLRLVREHGLEDAVSVPGFVAAEEIDAALRRALCMVLPSRREGYGMVVIEAAVRGTPSIVVDEPDNAAVELVEDGVNGVIAASAGADDLAAAILRVRDLGHALRDSTAFWYFSNEERLALTTSLNTVVHAYSALARGPGLG